MLDYKLTSVEKSGSICNCSKVLFSERPSASRVATSTRYNGKRSLSAVCCVSDGQQSHSEVEQCLPKGRSRISGVNERALYPSHYLHTYAPTQLGATFTSDVHTQCKSISNTCTHKCAPMWTKTNMWKYV